MRIKRSLFNYIQQELRSEPKIILLYGPRQAGKTTLIQQLFGRADLDRLKMVVGKSRLLVIDEAQRIENIGLALKLIFDHRPIHILASGSASLDLANRVSEPLSGRVSIFTLYPCSYNEIPAHPPRLQQRAVGGISAFRNVSKSHYRTYDQKEIDLSEERQGELWAYEFKGKRLPRAKKRPASSPRRMPTAAIALSRRPIMQ